jgi:hypothetical protein
MMNLFFAGDPSLDPTVSASARVAALHRRRREGYERSLFLDPPTSNFDEAHVGTIAAKAKARKFAAIDQARTEKVERECGLTVIPIDRLAALENALRDWLQLAQDDAASGGNGSEDIDHEELESRTRSLLDATTLIAPSDVRTLTPAEARL